MERGRDKCRDNAPLKREAGAFKFLRFEERFAKLRLRRISVDRSPDRRNNDNSRDVRLSIVTSG